MSWGDAEEQHDRLVAAAKAFEAARLLHRLRCEACDRLVDEMIAALDARDTAEALLEQAIAAVVALKQQQTETRTRAA